ncbi:MAG: tRNA pseudouridine(38-40) synthase TruA [Negativicutes bacterium]|nr:tRNA pseudouridine(38-40) synthase TruA [Negativicutes bacterium]
MKSIRLNIQYDGSRYHGWQRQANSLTIQQLIEEAITRLSGESVSLCGAGRTDAGVHALNQWANFKTESSIPAEKWSLALNHILPSDIRIMHSEECQPLWHARFVPHQKTYRYTIETAPVASPFRQAYVWHRRGDLQFASLQAAAALVLGEHDFSAFCASHSEVKNKVRRVAVSQWRQEDTRLIYSITGNGFLYNMVRLLVGFMVEIASGKREVQQMQSFLSDACHCKAGFTVPPQGLCLYEIVYEEMPVLLDISTNID